MIRFFFFHLIVLNQVWTFQPNRVGEDFLSVHRVTELEIQPQRMGSAGLIPPERSSIILGNKECSRLLWLSCFSESLIAFKCM